MSDTSGTGLFNDDKLVIVARILMAAATADGEYDGEEQEVIERVLKKYTGAERLPRSVLEALIGFDEDVFELQEELRGLGLTGPAEKKLLVEVVGAVLAADSVYELGEEAFFDQLCEQLGLTGQETAAIRESLDELPPWKD